MQISIGNLGAVIGTQLYRTETAPHFYLGHSFAMGYLVANIGVVLVLWSVLNRENRGRDAGLHDHKLEVVEETEWLGDEDPRWRFRV